MSGPYLHGQQGHFSYPKERALTIGARGNVEKEGTSNCSRRPELSPGGLGTLWVGASCTHVAAPRPAGDGRNLLLLEKPPPHHPSAFLKCLTVLGAL